MTLEELLAGETPLESGMVLRVHELGTLELPTGELVARDPLAGADAPPFLLSIAPSRYPVSLRVIHTPNAPVTREYFDIAALVIRFRDGACTRWDIALTDHDPEKHELRAGDYPGFQVDSAHAAFLDAAVQPALAAEDLQTRVSDAKQPPGGAMFTLPGGNMAFCTSGAGDGVYAMWVGYDAEDRAVAALVDFRMLPLVRPALLTDDQLDARVDVVAEELVDDHPQTVRTALHEAVALGVRAEPLVPLLEDLAVKPGSEVRVSALREQAARSLADLDAMLGLRANYRAVLLAGAPADLLELALTVCARLEWSDDETHELGAAAARIALSSSSPETVVAGVRCIDLFAVTDATVWTELASHGHRGVRIALLDACVRNFRAERVASYNEDEREYRARRVSVEVLDAVVASAMCDPDPDIRAAAANALGVAVAESPERRAALLPAIGDDDPRVVLAATQHLTFRKDLDDDLIARMRMALQRIVDTNERPYALKASSALRRLPQ